MRTIKEIKRERTKLLKLIIETKDDDLRKDFVGQSKALEWVLEDALVSDTKQKGDEQ